MNNHKLEIYKGSLSVFLIRGFSILAGYIFTFLVAFYYGAEGVGLFSISYTLLAMASLVSVLGFDVASVRLISENKSLENIQAIYLKILKVVIPFSLLLSIILFFSSHFISNVLDDNKLIINLRFVCLGILPLSLIFIHSEGLRGMKEVSLYSLLKYAMIPLFASIILLLIDKSKFINFEGPIFAYLVSILITFFISLFIWIKKNGYSRSAHNSISLKYLLNISIPILLTTSMFHIINWTDTIILGYYNTSHDIGIYNICFKMSMSSSIILFSINSIAAPKFSELYSSKKFIEFKNIIKLSSKIIFWLSIPILLIIAYKADFLLGIFGLDFKDGKIALYVLLFGQFINILCGSVGYILMMTNKQKILRNIMIVATLSNIILNIILIPIYGILGAAISTTVAVMIWNISSLIYIYKEYGFITINIIK